MNRSPRVLGSLAIAAVLATSTLAMAPASQAARSAPTPEKIVTSKDAWGDVRMFPGNYLTPREKKSIDIRRVTVGRVGNRAQVTITMREVIRTTKIDQVFLVNMVEHPDTYGGAWVTYAGFTTQGKMSYSSYSDPVWEEYENCGLTVTVRPRKRQVVATVPARCTPKAPVKVTVQSITGFFRTDAPQHSRDFHRVPGWHQIVEPKG